MHLSYNGFSFSGWQRQTNTFQTIQQALETQLSRLLKDKITLIGCGRTDAGVHASQYFAHFDHNHTLPEYSVFKLNQELSDDIVIHDIIPVEKHHHARYDATLRKYAYYISLRPDPFLSRYTAYYGNKKIDIDLLSEAINMISNYNDFTNMCRQPKNNDHCLCFIYESSVATADNKPLIKITLSANRFLKGMVRILVAKALDYATSNLSLSEYESILSNKSVRKFKNMAYPQGLYLTKIVYPYMELEHKCVMISVLDQCFSDVEHH